MVRVLFVMKVCSACQHTLCLVQPRRISSIWHGMLCPVMSQKMMFETLNQVKITTDMTGYAPAGEMHSFSPPRL